MVWKHGARDIDLRALDISRQRLEGLWIPRNLPLFQSQKGG